MKLLTSIASLGCLAALASGCVVTAGDGADASLLVSNHSDFEIHEMYVTEVGSPTWG